MKREQIVSLFKETKSRLRKGIWLSGKPGEGEFMQWHEDGILQKHCHFKDGKLHGEYRNWHSNGQLFKLSFYKDDLQHGVEKIWTKEGKVWGHSLYKNGTFIKHLN